MKKIMIAALLAAAAAPAAAVTPLFEVTLSAPIGVATNNEYKDALADVGLTNVARAATITVTGAGKVTYTYLGSESRLVDRFVDGTAGPSFETNANVSVWDAIVQRPFAPVEIGSTGYMAAGPLTASYLSGTGDTITPGNIRFGVFTAADAGDSFSSSTIYFSLDDRPTGDGDFDDFIIRATISAVPEPAAWTLMIAGFGLVGFGARKNRRSTMVIA